MNVLATEKFSPSEVIDNEPTDNSAEFVSFSKAEWKHFTNEISKQVSENSKVIDFGKAARNARYLAKLDRAFADKKGVTMTFDALEKLINEERSVSR